MTSVQVTVLAVFVAVAGSPSHAKASGQDLLEDVRHAHVRSLDRKATLRFACWLDGNGMTARVGRGDRGFQGLWKQAEDTAARRLAPEGASPEAIEARILGGWRAHYSMWFEGGAPGRGWDFRRHSSTFLLMGADSLVAFAASRRYESMTFEATIIIPDADEPLVAGTDVSPVSFRFFLGGAAHGSFYLLAARCDAANRLAVAPSGELSFS